MVDRLMTIHKNACVKFIYLYSCIGEYFYIQVYIYMYILYIHDNNGDNEPNCVKVKSSNHKRQIDEKRGENKCNIPTNKLSTFDNS